MPHRRSSATTKRGQNARRRALWLELGVVDKTSTPRKTAVEIRWQEADLQKSIHPLYLAVRDNLRK
jgi:hypothetical protein